MKAVPGEQIPITASVLTWARERAGLSLSEAKDKFKNLPSWEQGLSHPTYAQLESLSQAFKIPLAVFFFPAPPVVPPIEETFRTLPATEIAKLPGQIRYLIRKGKAFQLSLDELTAGRNPSAKVITREMKVDAGVKISALAEQARSYLDVSIEQQKSWSDVDHALKHWRKALFDAGIFVFKDAFKAPEYSGFSLYDDTFPIMYVNNSSAKSRQIFTYFHELAHLLLHTSGIDTLHDYYISNLKSEDQQIEILCNKFAAIFLLPEDDFARVSKNLPATEASAEQLAALYKVSREVIFRRFLDEGRISEDVYTQAANKWNKQFASADSENGSGNYYWTKLTYLGKEYVNLALTQYHQNRIDENQLSDYLDIKPKNVASLDEYFQRSGV